MLQVLGSAASVSLPLPPLHYSYRSIYGHLSSELPEGVLQI